MLEFILADQLADVSPHLQASHGQEWQFQIAIVTAHIERATGRSTPQNTGIHWSRMAISDFYVLI